MIEIRPQKRKLSQKNLFFANVNYTVVDYLFKGKLKFILTCNFSKNDCNVFENLPCFLIDVIQAWADFNFHNPVDIKQIISQSIWYNSHIKIDNTPKY